MKRTSLYLVLGGCAFAGAVWFWQADSNESNALGNSSDTSEPVVTDGSSEAVSTSVSVTNPSPFSVEDSSSLTLDSTPVEKNTTNRGNEAASTSADQGSEAGRLFAQSVDVTSLGRSDIEEAEFLQLAEALRSDPELLQQLIDEFRQETDPDRRSSLLRLLGEVGGSSVTLTATELIYSGDAASRRLGLDLLQHIQPGNAAARDIASTLLATEVESEILVDTLTSLARPGAVDENSRQLLSDQVAFLADHEDTKVRSISLNILSRWSKDGRYTEVLRNGLSDVEPVVRESAAYALVGHENVSPTLIDSLLIVATDATESMQARRGAILALKGMPIDSTIRQQVIAAELELDTVRR